MADSLGVPVDAGVGDMVAALVSVGNSFTSVASGVRVSMSAKVSVTSGRRKLQALKRPINVSRASAWRISTNCSRNLNLKLIISGAGRNT